VTAAQVAQRAYSVAALHRLMRAASSEGSISVDEDDTRVVENLASDLMDELHALVDKTGMELQANEDHRVARVDEQVIAPAVVANKAARKRRKAVR
jgi:hypothetical protein